MIKRLRKGIMTRSKLCNEFNKSRNSVNLQNCRKQRNKCTKVLRKEKQQYFNNLNSKNITDTKIFWKTVKPLIGKKSVDKKFHRQKISSIIKIRHLDKNSSLFTDEILSRAIYETYYKTLIFPIFL